MLLSAHIIPLCFVDLGKMGTKVLQKYQISSYLLEMIEKSENKLTLISPYVSPWGHLLQTIDTAIIRGVEVELFYRINVNGKQDSDYYLEEPIEKLEKLGVVVYGVENLHTKLYLSDKSAIMSSMNLYEYSSRSNEEIGIYTDDEILLKQFQSYILDLEKRSYHIER